jgi:hypothetical protein
MLRRHMDTHEMMIQVYESSDRTLETVFPEKAGERGRFRRFVLESDEYVHNVSDEILGFRIPAVFGTVAMQRT